MDREASIKLLAAILADLPQLTGASCIGKHRAFDPIVGNGHLYQHQEQIRLAEAARLCAGCPARAKCSAATLSTTGSVPKTKHPG
jgi:hypothetical protein